MLCFGGPLHGQHASACFDALPGFTYAVPEELEPFDIAIHENAVPLEPEVFQAVRYERITLAFARGAQHPERWHCWYDTSLDREELVAELLPRLRAYHARRVSRVAIDQALQAWCRTWEGFAGPIGQESAGVARSLVGEETSRRLANLHNFGMTHPEWSGGGTPRHGDLRFFESGPVPEVDYAEELADVPTIDEMWAKMESLGITRDE